MTKRAHIFGRILTILFLLASARALGEPYQQKPGEVLHLNTPGNLHTDGGSDVRTLAGYLYDQISFSDLDKEMKRLQEAETRLVAENKSLRKSASGWRPGWITITSTLVTGIALGVYLSR